MREDPFPGVGRAELAARIDNARISPTDREIARMRLLDCEAWSDIGAAVHMDRRTAARRLDRIKGIL